MGTGTIPEALLTWIRDFDHHLLQNEDDVETKFVLPLFRHLGYPDECRRGKYPCEDRTISKAGRKREADQVYFVVPEPDQQNTNTSLVVVEAKAPAITNLSEAMAQAKEYAAYLKCSFLVVTNGYLLKVLKRHSFYEDEPTFDDTVEALKEAGRARTFYKEFNFETVKHIKEHQADSLFHSQYVLLDQSLRRYPDLQLILDKGDFQPSVSREGNCLKVREPKVAISCNLPVAFEEGSCQIEFSSITRRGLIVHLNHQTILGTLILGLGTPPSDQARYFLRQVNDDSFEAILGTVTTTLSKDEAVDLCKCVDKMCQAYKDTIIEAENTLETWDYAPLPVEDVKGFCLFSVKKPLWDLMKRYAKEFDYMKGDTEWHIFRRTSSTLDVHSKFEDHASVWPIVDGKVIGLLSSTNHSVSLIYVLTPLLSVTLTENEDDWQKHVGPKGVWTAKFTQKWLLDKFIPTVKRYYWQRYSAERSLTPSTNIFKPSTWFRKSLEQEPIGSKVINHFSPNDFEVILNSHQVQHIPLNEIIALEQLSTYLDEIQFHFLRYPDQLKIPASLFRPYYAAMTDLAKLVKHAEVILPYTTEKVAAADLYWPEDLVRTGPEASDPDEWIYQDVINSLEQHTTRIQVSDYESPRVAHLLSSAFGAILERGGVECSQAQLNTTLQALRPLWDQVRFEMRYVTPNRLSFNLPQAWIGE